MAKEIPQRVDEGDDFFDQLVQMFRRDGNPQKVTWQGYEWTRVKDSRPNAKEGEPVDMVFFIRSSGAYGLIDAYGSTSMPGGRQVAAKPTVDKPLTKRQQREREEAAENMAKAKAVADGTHPVSEPGSFVTDDGDKDKKPE